MLVSIRSLIFAAVALLSPVSLRAQGGYTVVADSVSHAPLPSASVFDCRGNFIGVSNTVGRLPYVSPADYPITVRYIGFNERVVDTASSDTIFMSENLTELPEVVVESQQHKVLHMLGYVREYSMLTTYSDTVFLFREKMVDYMLTPEKKMRFRGWANPRVLKSKSYYRFTNHWGLDSVSDKCNHHFSWSDWIGIAPPRQLPRAIKNVESATDTLHGKYSATEVWTRNNDRIAVDVDVMADTASRVWVPNLSGFFRNYLDFDNFKLRYSFGNVVEDTIRPANLTAYSFNIESKGRGHDMFMFNRVNQSFYVSTYAEIYIVDKEYITVKEARKWDRRKINTDDIEIYEPAEAPELQPSIQLLVDRVNNIDSDQVRAGIEPDHRMKSRGVRRETFGDRALSLLKTLTGISHFRSKKNFDKQYRNFQRNKSVIRAPYAPVDTIAAASD